MKLLTPSPNLRGTTICRSDVDELRTSNLVSVVIPVFNGLEHIDETLASVRAQTHSNIEIVVVDDGSTDGTLDFLRCQRDIVVYEQVSQGPGSARNAGALIANGNWLAFAECVDLWSPDKLECQLAAAKDSAAEMVYSDIQPIDGRRNTTRSRSHQDATLCGDVFANVLTDNFIALSSVMIKRSAFEELGGFTQSPTVRGTEDWDLWLRYLATERTIAAVPDPLVTCRYPPDDMAVNLTRIHEARLATLNNALKTKRGQSLSPSKQQEARAALFAGSACSASRCGHLSAVRLYLNSWLAGADSVEVSKGVVTAISNWFRRGSS